MDDLLAALGAGGWAIVSLVSLLAALLFIPWREPSRRAERLLLAWRGHADSCAGTASGRQMSVRDDGSERD